jgi:hypothetical protein
MGEHTPAESGFGARFLELSLCASATPEDLAREVVEELKRQSAGAVMLLGMWMGI